MKICLLGVSFDTNNMGVSALAAGAVACALHGRPDAEISLLDYGKEGKTVRLSLQGKTVPVRLVNIRFSKKFWVKNNIARLIVEVLISRLIPFQSLQRAWIRRNASLAHVDEMDAIAAISGGDSFSDIYGMVRFVYISLPQVLALLMRKRLVLLPQTVGPFKGSIAKAGARYILRHAEAVYSRDREGVETTTRLLGMSGDSKNIRCACDVGFVVESQPPATKDWTAFLPRRSDGTALVGVNVSGLLLMGGYSRDNAFGLKTDYRKLVCDIVESLARSKRSAVLLVPHVFGNSEESDPTACEAIYEKLKYKLGTRLGVLHGVYNLHEIKYVIGQCDFFIGSRMHACIAAVSQCIPTVPIAYSDKFIGVMETVDAGHLVADPRKMSESDILTLIDRAFEDRHAIRRQFEQKIPQVKERVLGLFHEIANSRPDTGAEAAAAAAVPDQVT
jgi:colanic acid/amylovoran biosynthesis protein WcaK/AmsJ